MRYTVGGSEEVVIESSAIEKEDPYREEVRSWVDAVTKRTPMVFDGYDGMAAVELAEAAYRSASTGRPVKLPLRAGRTQ